ncbi:hypothetical protein UlMin_039205 [Ulmus minor]
MVGEAEAISFMEAKRLMRLVNVEALKTRLGAEGKEVISYCELLEACEIDLVRKVVPIAFTLGYNFQTFTLYVNFEAWLEDGMVIAKSDGVEFTAVKSMKKGHKVLLTVKPQYGFGEKGKPAIGSEGSVPPNKNLEITLELVSWKIVSEVTDDIKFIKKIVKEGEGYEHPNEGAIVKFPDLIWILHLPMKLTGKLQDGIQVIEGLDRAVLTIKKGGVALLSIAPEYAFCSSESRQELVVVPTNSTIYYDVELVSFEMDKESWDLNTEEKVVAASRKKKEGNVLFKVGKYARASKRYDKAVKFIEYDISFSEEEKKQAKALKVACNLNNAACKLKLEDYKQFEKLCTEAYIQLADLDLAEFDIKKVLEIDLENRDVKLEYKKLKEKLKEYNKKEAKFYGNMFAKMSKLDTHESDFTSQNNACNLLDWSGSGEIIEINNYVVFLLELL